MQINHDLRSLNTLRLPARARRFVAAYSRADVEAGVASLGRPVVLGGGSNTVFAGDADAVLQVCLKGIEVTGSRVAVAGGEAWQAVVDASLANGLSGLENLTRIPGSAGAAPVQNIGAYGVELSEFLVSVTAYDMAADCWCELGADDCQFAYRDSRFKREPGRYVITGIVLQLSRRFAPRVDYGTLAAELVDTRVESPHDVERAVSAIRARRLPDPAVEPNAGSFFKNPVVDSNVAARLALREPELAQTQQANGSVKLSAAWLIERAGMKGACRGDACISTRHALVLINRGRATPEDVLALAGDVTDQVASRFGVSLEVEPAVVGLP